MLFSDTCKKITLSKESDLNDIAKYIKYFTFEKDNSTNAHECKSFYLFLIAAFKIQKIILPVEILKNDSPDFRLSRINEEPFLGLEHTRATVEKYKMDESELAKKYPEGSLMELPFYSTKSSPSKKSNIALKKPWEPLESSGYGNYGIEKQWTEIILHTLEKKTRKLNTERYKKYKRNELLIEDYDSPTCIFYRFDSAIKMLKNTYSQKTNNELLTYDKVHVYSCHRIIYDVFRETIIVDISKS